MPQPQRVDVVIIGLGAAGGVLAKELATAGMKVVALERGDFIQASDLNHMDELRMSVRGGLSNNFPYRTTTRPDDRSPARVQSSDAAGVGGQTLHWAAMAWRNHEDDFRVRSATLARYGEEALPADNLIEDWPLTYADLERYYDQAEYELGVSGVWAKSGGNVFEAPRARDYPMPPLLEDAASRAFREAAASLRLHPFPNPAAILSRNYTGPLGVPRSGCTYCGFCRNHACMVNAKASTLVTVIPVALATGNLEIRTRCNAVKVNVDANGKRARSVSYYDATGTLREQEAGVIVVSAGSLRETVRLLLVSKSDSHPAGLGNSSGWLGKGYMGHLRPSLVALYDDRVLNAHIGPNHPNTSIDDFNGDNFDHKGLGFIRGGVIFNDVGGSGGPLAFYNQIPPSGPRWGNDYKKYLARYFTRSINIAAWTENLPTKGSYVDLDPNVTDRYGLQVARVTTRRQPNDDKMLAFMLERMKEIAKASGASQYWVNVANPQPTGHESGGARMGTAQSNSVTNRWGQVWDAPNVFVSSTALYPTMSGYNPTLTIFAIAYAQGAFIRREARPGGEIARHL